MDFLKKLIKSEYIQQVFTLSSGTTFAHIITIVSYLILTKLYDPVHIGDFSFFHSAIVILSILATATFEFAIVLPNTDNRGAGVLAVSIISTTLFSLFLALIIILLNPYFAKWFDIDKSLLFYIIPGTFLVAIFNSLTYWYVRTDQYKKLSKGKIVQSSSTALAQIGSGILNWISYGMIGGYIIGRTIANVYLFIKTTFCRSKKILSSNYLLALVKKYSEQPKFIVFSRLLSQGALEIPVFLISILFNNELLGYYGLAYRVLSVPSSFIGNSVGHVFYKHLSLKHNKNLPTTPFLLRTWGGLFLTGIIPMILLFFWGEELFQLVFGQTWGAAGTIATIMAPVLLFKFVTAPTEKAMLVFGHQKMVPLFSAIDFVGRVSGLYLGYVQNAFFWGIAYMVGFQLIAIFLLNMYIFSLSRVNDKQKSTPND